MPIYEYYCPACDARFQHLARTFNPAPPPCPGCGNTAVEKLISVASLGRSEAALREEFDVRARAARDADADPQTAARLLQEGGALLDEVTPPGVDRDTFREIVARRAQGAGEEDFQDLVASMPLPQPPAHLHEHAHEHTHPHEHGHEHTHAQEHSHTHARGRRRARHLGWG